ncbi:Bug family tripartite tricarboxylate transporter substrate binding protein [Tardiphaga sp. 866_E4_N2_1]|uniref:Bug family tripartite tricarboxylate transporter substrate binding protein n=1 Tax=unclassified Tardiphaga TaxID=2631404 RepID=UPI003F28BAF4
MLNSRWLRLARLAALIAVAILPSRAFGADYPTKLVRIIVPFPPGGVYDLYSRMAAEHLTKAFGQQFIIENSSGGQGVLGSQLAAKAEPDGYTLLMGGQATHATNPHLFGSMKFNTLTDFEPIAMVAILGNVLVVNPGLPVKTVPEFVAYSKANPGKVTFSHAGSGTSMSIAGELFQEKAGVKLLSIPYRGSALAANAVVTGEVQSMFANTISVVSQIRAGTVRPLGVTTTARQDLIPDVVPISEQGVPGYEMRSWFGLFAPAKTPKPIISKINAEIRKMVELPEYKKRILESGATSGAFTPEEFSSFVKADYDAIGKIVREAGLKPESN